MGNSLEQWECSYLSLTIKLSRLLRGKFRFADKAGLLSQLLINSNTLLHLHTFMPCLLISLMLDSKINIFTFETKLLHYFSQKKQKNRINMVNITSFFSFLLFLQVYLPEISYASVPGVIIIITMIIMIKMMIIII